MTRYWYYKTQNNSQDETPGTSYHWGWGNSETHFWGDDSKDFSRIRRSRPRSSSFRGNSWNTSRDESRKTSRSGSGQASPGGEDEKRDTKPSFPESQRTTHKTPCVGEDDDPPIFKKFSGSGSWTSTRVYTTSSPSGQVFSVTAQSLLLAAITSCSWLIGSVVWIVTKDEFSDNANPLLINFVVILITLVLALLIRQAAQLGPNPRFWKTCLVWLGALLKVAALLLLGAFIQREHGLV